MPSPPGRSRLAWAGYAAGGWSSLIIWLATPATVGFVNGPLVMFGTLLANVWIDSINKNAAMGGVALIQYRQTAHALDVILFGMIGALLSRVAAARSRVDEGADRAS